jgi:Prion-inhibition and propagation
MDVSGFVFSALTVASLFKTCIELFDYFELGKNHVYDHQLAGTKICLLKARLSAWGVSVNLGDPDPAPSGGHHTSYQHWTEEQDVIMRGLSSIKDLFEDAAVLSEKYRLVPQRTRRVKAILFSAYRSEDSLPHHSKTSSTAWAFLRKRTVWAIHDKQKFDAFIADLSFLIDNLEKVAEHIEMAFSSKQLVGAKESSERSQPSVDTRPKHSKGKQIDLSNSAKIAFVGNSSLNIHQLAKGMDGNIYTGDQTVTEISVMGAVGKSDRRHIYTGSQDVKRHGFAVMGDISVAAAVHLRERREMLDKELDARVEEMDLEYDEL